MYNLHMLTRDYGQICRYAAQNAALKTPARVVFLGDSITDNWIGADASLFANGLLDRGISGQTTPQMLIRFRNDVVLLHPKAVHIMAGTNDIAGNTGAATMATVEGNIASMAELAHANGIKVILASTPPASAFPWNPSKRPSPQIVELNAWIRGYAKTHGYTYVDYYTALTTPEGGMKPGLSSDGVHPTPAGYAIMKPPRAGCDRQDTGNRQMTYDRRGVLAGTAASSFATGRARGEIERCTSKAANWYDLTPSGGGRGFS
ncbi:SGNH/GDSL hydrolase family protein [Sphingomonas sp. H160509]|uniref:SGNH/GDSL hydrolase family protein n=1 Tax=Sphingomonas sp. H160509 TaxID=2955313 RepID=UPI002097727B|nr:SGNH/GDSL hydrolase family protein [Sphingomonas sp. H160509]MDD1449971.1 SGNH/GDSL hydrolase family protein [Sphingomonas sp. H160509]